MTTFVERTSLERFYNLFENKSGEMSVYYNFKHNNLKLVEIVVPKTLC